MSDASESIRKYVRAANYLSAAQIYLQGNYLLERPLTSNDIKPRLLGHWGTCPGVNFVYAHLNQLIVKYSAEMLFILGPGHGHAAIQANLFMEGTLGNYYPEATTDEKGIGYIAKNFSWPHGFPSHVNPGTPGAILEGGELGYALATAYGSVLDNPNLITACMIGDGEAETGPTATAWHLHRFLDPATNGAVLPILHLNGYKISGPTIFGRMTDDELTHLFTGYGYEPLIVGGDDDHLYETMPEVIETCYQKIRAIQESARKGERAGGPPRFPMIVLHTLKGWTGIKELNGLKIEGNYPSHQVIAPNAKADPVELAALEAWLRSYRFGELFDGTAFASEIAALIPESSLCMGASIHAFGGKIAEPLDLPSAEEFSEDASVPGAEGSSSMRRSGLFLNDVFKRNSARKNFRLFSPDETYSNKLDEVFKTTGRAFDSIPTESWDKDLTPDGRVMEMLSEHSLQGMMQGYALTGRHAVFASYEAFIQIVTSMVDQYLKFLKASREFSWRGGIPSLTYILTSSGWRQEHNGFSHQNPGFITDMLQKPGCATRVFFPPDGNSTLVVLRESLQSKDSINVIVAGKTLEPRWLTPEQATQEYGVGLATWDFASEDDPHVVFAAVGDYLTKESLAAITILKAEDPTIRVRFVNILELSALGIGNAECRVPIDFDDYFTPDKPVIFNFHGYPATLQQVLFGYGATNRFSVHGYIENGSTTTPFDMHVWNKTDRYHLAIDAFGAMNKHGFMAAEKADALIKKYEDKLLAHRAYIVEHGVDPDDVETWTWKNFK